METEILSHSLAKSPSRTCGVDRGMFNLAQEGFKLRLGTKKILVSWGRLAGNGAKNAPRLGSVFFL